MKKFFAGLLVGIIISAACAAGAYSLSIEIADFPIVVNGERLITDNLVIAVNGSTYLPLAEIGKALGTNVRWNDELKQVEVGNSVVSEKSKSNLPMSITADGMTITINKVIQDSDSLRLYVTYTNIGNKTEMTGDSIVKVIANGKQYEYNSDFNFERYYKKDVAKAPFSIEPSVSADSVIFFAPIKDVEKVNIVMGFGSSHKFNNVVVEK